MKRLLLSTGVLALVFVVYGVPAGSVAQAGATEAAKIGKVPAVAVARRQAAERKAKKLLREFALPAGATPLRPGGAKGLLSRSGLPSPAYGKLVARHGFWQVPRPLSSVLAWIKRHPPQGLKLGTESRRPGAPANATLDFSSHRRLLTVTLVRLPGRTAVRVDAGAVWIYPRSPQEALPGGVTTIDIVSEHSTTTVVDPQKVGQIVTWFDELGVLQPEGHVICPLVPFAPPVTFSFRSDSGGLLALATAPAIGPSTQCSPIQFSIGGVRQTPLIGGDFVMRVERLLGVRFVGALP